MTPESEPDYHFEDAEVLSAVRNTPYAIGCIARHLHLMTCDQKWSLYRAIAALSARITE